MATSRRPWPRGIMTQLVRLTAYALLGCHVGAYASNSIETIRIVNRDLSLDVPLHKLLSSPLDHADGSAVAMDLKLQQALAQCRMHGISRMGSSISSSLISPAEEQPDQGNSQLPQRDDVEYCHRVRYVRHMRQRYRDMWAAISSGQIDGDAAVAGGGSISSRPSVELRNAEELDYQTFFETFEETSTAVMLQKSSGSARTTIAGIGFHGNDLDAFLSRCFDASQPTSSLRVERDECKEHLTQFRMPMVAINNFLPRTNVSHAASLLPTLVSVSEATASQTTCRFGLHTLLMLVGPAHTVEYSLYPARFAPYEPPLVESDENPPGYSEVSVAADLSVVVEEPSATPHLLDRRRSPLHFVEPTFHGVLDTTQSLFVPGGKYFVTVTASRPAKLLRFCFLDASNLNHVTESLRIDGLVSSAARTLFFSLLAPSFDTSMTRRPAASDAMWPNYIQWPKQTKASPKRRGQLHSDNSGDGEAAGDQAHMSRRERLKLWQDDKRWAHHIESLTLPVPLPPVVINTTRTTAILRWQDLYERPKNDITVFGYEIRWTRDQDMDQQLSGAVNFTHHDLQRSAMPTTHFGEEFDGKHIEGVVYGLAADTSYSFSVRIGRIYCRSI